MRGAYEVPQPRQPLTLRDNVVAQYRARKQAEANAPAKATEEARRNAYTKMLNFFNIHDQKAADSIEINEIEGAWVASFQDVNLAPAGSSLRMAFNCSACGEATLTYHGVGNLYDLGQMIEREDAQTIALDNGIEPVDPILPWAPHWDRCKKLWKANEEPEAEAAAPTLEDEIRDLVQRAAALWIKVKGD